MLAGGAALCVRGGPCKYVVAGGQEARSTPRGGRLMVVGMSGARTEGRDKQRSLASMSATGLKSVLESCLGAPTLTPEYSRFIPQFRPRRTIHPLPPLSTPHVGLDFLDIRPSTNKEAHIRNSSRSPRSNKALTGVQGPALPSSPPHTPPPSSTKHPLPVYHRTKVPTAPRLQVAPHTRPRPQIPSWPVRANQESQAGPAGRCWGPPAREEASLLKEGATEGTLC